MHSIPAPTPASGTITVRAGCALAYQATRPTVILLMVRPRLQATQTLLEEAIALDNRMPAESFTDTHGNLVCKTLLLPGLNTYRYDALLETGTAPDNHLLPTELTPVQHLPPEVLRYTLPSRYCESDKLCTFARQRFGHLAPGMQQVAAICDWIHRHVEYRYGSGSSLLSAADIIVRGYGVCRDFAHLTIALCRALDLPARYVAGHLPYRGIAEADVGVDFQAYCEVYLGGCWHTFDARFNAPHCGRIKIAHGMDAADTAFASIFGDAVQVQFQVWAYQVTASAARLTLPVAIMQDDCGNALLQAGE